MTNTVDTTADDTTHRTIFRHKITERMEYDDGIWRTEVFLHNNEDAHCAKFGKLDNTIILCRHESELHVVGKVKELRDKLQKHIDTNVQYVA